MKLAHRKKKQFEIKSKDNKMKSKIQLSLEDWAVRALLVIHVVLLMASKTSLISSLGKDDQQKEGQDYNFNKYNIFLVSNKYQMTYKMVSVQLLKRENLMQISRTFQIFIRRTIIVIIGRIVYYSAPGYFLNDSKQIC